VAETNVLVDGRALDRADGVAVRTAVRVVEQVRHDVMSHYSHLVAAVLAQPTPVRRRATHEARRCRRRRLDHV